jgi:hypothetical protein
MNYKVVLTPEDKREIKMPSAPRWELDLVGYKASTNTVRFIECKSYLDSAGVRYAAFEDPPDNVHAKRLKLFVKPDLRRVVFNRAVKQLQKRRYVSSKAYHQACACRRSYQERRRAEVVRAISQDQWLLFDADWLCKELRRVTNDGYEDETASLVVKLLSKRPNSQKQGL